MELHAARCRGLVCALVALALVVLRPVAAYIFLVLDCDAFGVEGRAQLHDGPGI